MGAGLVTTSKECVSQCDLPGGRIAEKEGSVDPIWLNSMNY